MLRAVDDAIGKNPLVVTAEGLVMRMSDGIDTVKGATGEIIKNSRALLESSYAKFMQQLELEIAELRPLFEATRKGFGTFANKNVKIDYKHILGMNLRFNGRGGISGISGFHHDMMNVIEKSGVFEFASKVIHKSGFYKAKLLQNGNLIKEITFFPSHWSRKQVMNAVIEAYDNFKSTGRIPQMRSDGKFLIKGFTKEGIEIEMYITQNMLITTAYPVLK